MAQRRKRSSRVKESPSKFVPFSSEVDVEKTRRRLPHWHQTGVTYFVTFRLADSIPQNKARELQQFKQSWLRRHPGPLTERQKSELRRTISEKIEILLTAGFGSCVLADGKVADILEGILRRFDGMQYDLGWFVIMPNHVHLLVRPREGFFLPNILKSWKGVSSNEINRLFEKKGTLWLEESFDHIVRDQRSLKRFEKYIQENPARAGLETGRYRLGHGRGADTLVCPTN